MTESVLITKNDRIGRIEINRPEQRNALNDDVLSRIVSGLQQHDEDADIRVIVVTAVGDKAFCAGGDLGAFLDTSSGVAAKQAESVRALFKTMEQTRKPIVGRINGHALAGGMGLALGCDVLVATEEATFGLPEILVGLWPMMVMALLRRDLGHKRAMELMLLGGRLSAQEAQQWGLVNRVVAAKELDATVDEVVHQLAQRSSQVVGLGKRAWHDTLSLDFDAALNELSRRLVNVLNTEDANEGIHAFFEKRTPNFS